LFFILNKHDLGHAKTLKIGRYSLQEELMKVEKYMSKNPVTINSHQSLKYALETMKEHDIRHLPVLERGKTCGILSERDIRFLESVEKVELEGLKVSDAFSDDIYAVTPETDIKEVCKIMHDNKIGSVIVNDNDQLTGIFTWIDALRFAGKL
jgi:acetoin utilization protein AcuB